MAEKMKLENLIVIGLLVFVVFTMSKQPQQPPTVITNSGGGTPPVDLCKLVESEVSLTGQRMFAQATALTGEWARVLQVNGDGTIKDKSYVSMNSGTTDTKPNANYKIYFSKNSSGSTTKCGGTCYYTQPVAYTAPCDDATDDKVGVVCLMDTTPTITVFDEYGRPQASDCSSNAQSITTSDQKDLTVRVKVSADQCYGNPYAGDRKNAICFKYITNASGYQSVTGDTGVQDKPYTITANNATAKYDIDCYKLDLLKDTEYQDIKVHLTADDNFAMTSHANITVLVDDIDMDIDADTLEEIWGFADEDNNELGIPGGISATMCITS